MIGSRATDSCEPCQVLTEAALSSIVGVPRGCLIGATCWVPARECPSKGWVRGIFFLTAAGNPAAVDLF